MSFTPEKVKQTCLRCWTSLLFHGKRGELKSGTEFPVVLTRAEEKYNRLLAQDRVNINIVSDHSKERESLQSNVSLAIPKELWWTGGLRR